TALCDLAGIWPVMTVTRRLAEAADAAVTAAVRFLFRQAAKSGDWLSDGPDGYIVLGMGKHGAFELNYSSDIDLIVFYDLARIRHHRGGRPQHQGRPRRHPRDRVLRPDPAADRWRPPARAARLGHPDSPGASGGAPLDHRRRTR